MSDTDPDSYLTIGDGPEAEWRVKGSRFLGRGLGVEDAAQADGRLRAVRRAHHAAAHHCWAWRLGPPGSVAERFDDDGEPSGTAGRPILTQLRARELHDVLLVVTRYFGGTKLGTGGLARAYGEAAARALDAAPRRTVHVDARLEIRCSYDDVGAVEAAIARSASDVDEVRREFTPEPRFLVSVRRSRGPALARTIVEATGGRATTHPIDAED